MINLLQSSACGRTDVGEANNTKNAQFLGQNLQKNANLKSEKLEDTMKIEHISCGDQIAFIKIQDDLSSASPIKKRASDFHRRTQFQKFFMELYPDFMRHYCLCMQRKVEPNDPINMNSHHRDHYNDDHYNNHKYAANSFLLSHTSIIPITVVPKKYELYLCIAFSFQLFICLLPNKNTKREN